MKVMIVTMPDNIITKPFLPIMIATFVAINKKQKHIKNRSALPESSSSLSRFQMYSPDGITRKKKHDESKCSASTVAYIQ